MAICASKGVILVCMISLCVCVHLIGSLDAKEISYGAIGRNGIPGCSVLRPENCVRIPVNPYQRGCEHEARCRDHYAPPGIGDDPDDDNKEIDGHSPQPRGHDDYRHGKTKQTLKIRGVYKVIPSPPN